MKQVPKKSGQKKTSAAVILFKVALNIILCAALIFMGIKTKDLVDTSFSSQNKGMESMGMPDGQMGQPGGSSADVSWSGAADLSESQSLDQ